ncbi:hypothetical protein F4677DRAFT_428922, partial [Hypoxylon crocopeplum]
MAWHGVFAFLFYYISHLVVQIQGSCIVREDGSLLHIHTFFGWPGGWGVRFAQISGGGEWRTLTAHEGSRLPRSLVVTGRSWHATIHINEATVQQMITRSYMY